MSARLLLVRHAHAGDRGAWVGDDAERPLSARGTAQADALTRILPPLLGTDAPVVAASPAVRCRATVAPLATTLGVVAEVDRGLHEGAAISALRARFAGLARPTVWCSHGDVIPALLLALTAEGLDLGPDPRSRKGSTWVLDVVAGDAVAARYLPPPDVTG